MIQQVEGRDTGNVQTVLSRVLGVVCGYCGYIRTNSHRALWKRILVDARIDERSCKVGGQAFGLLAYRVLNILVVKRVEERAGEDEVAVAASSMLPTFK